MDLLFTGKKTAVLADKSDPDVQFTAHWSKPTKNEQSLGLDSIEVQQKLDACRADVKRARELFQLLKDAGLLQCSVGSIDSAAYVLVFAEPTPAMRKQILTAVTSVLESRTTQPQTSIWVEIMEPAFYHNLFQDIVPHAIWQRPGTLMSYNKIMSVDFEWNKRIPVSDLMQGWELNKEANRAIVYQKSAYLKAQAWAKKNLPQPFYLEPEQMVSYNHEIEPNNNKEQHLLEIRFGFPYFDNKPVEADSTETNSVSDLEPKGYVTGIYNVDDQSFTKIKVQKEK
jgi:hypothetical protein